MRPFPSEAVMRNVKAERLVSHVAECLTFLMGCRLPPRWLTSLMLTFSRLTLKAGSLEQGSGVFLLGEFPLCSFLCSPSSWHFLLSSGVSEMRTPLSFKIHGWQSDMNSEIIVFRHGVNQELVMTEFRNDVKIALESRRGVFARQTEGCADY